MSGLHSRDVVVDGSDKFAPRPIPRDYSGRSDDEAFGVVFDLSDSNVALDERSVMRFARALAFGDGKTSLRPAAIAAGAHRSYIACLFAQLPQAERVIGVFGTTAEARAWLANRSGAHMPLPAYSALRVRRS